MRTASSYCLTILFSLLCSLGLAQSRYCVPGIEPAEQGELAYKERDHNRCEGFYVQEVSSTDISLVSLTQNNLTKNTGTVTLTWHVPSATEQPQVNIQGLGIKSRLYYRMDTSETAIGEQGQFDWPTEVLRKAGITSEAIGKDIGVLAWVEVQGTTPVYLSLSLLPSDPASGGGYTFVLMPDAALDKIRASYGFVTDDLPTLESSLSNVKLESWYSDETYHPARVALTIPELPFTSLEAKGKGIYLVQIKAVANSSLPITKEFLFYHGN
jgi:hypothetical protein